MFSEIADAATQCGCTFTLYVDDGRQTFLRCAPAVGATETYLAHQLPDKAGAIATPAGLLALLLVVLGVTDMKEFWKFTIPQYFIRLLFLTVGAVLIFPMA